MDYVHMQALPTQFSSNPYSVSSRGRASGGDPSGESLAEVCNIFLNSAHVELRARIQSCLEEQFGQEARARLVIQAMTACGLAAGMGVPKRISSRRDPDSSGLQSRATSEARCSPNGSVSQKDPVLVDEMPTVRASVRPAFMMNQAPSDKDTGPPTLEESPRRSGHSSGSPRRLSNPEDAPMFALPATTASGKFLPEVRVSTGSQELCEVVHFVPRISENGVASTPQTVSETSQSQPVYQSFGQPYRSLPGIGDPHTLTTSTTAFLMAHTPGMPPQPSVRAALPLDEAWNYERVHSDRGSRRSSRSSMSQTVLPGGRALGSSQNMVRSGDVVQGSGCPWMLHPNSLLVMLWDVWTLIAATHDMIMAPLVAFVDDGVSKSTFVKYTEIISLVTWVFDIALTCFKGYIDGNLGIVELRPRYVLWRYFRTWLPFDILLVTIDVVLLILENTWTELLGALRLVRMFRIGRMLRLLKVSVRLSRQKEAANFLVTSMPSATGTVMSVIRNLLIIMLANHFAACGWYALGHLDYGGGPPGTWLDGLEGCEDAVYCYSTAYHFTMTQFTPSSTRVDASNTAERIYEVCCILMGLVVFSAFLGSMTQNLLHYRQLTATESEQRLHTMRYLSQHKVSVHLAARILGFLRNQSPHNRIMKFSDLHGLENMPVMLQRELQEEVFTPVILRHPLFARLWGMDLAMFNRLCHTAMWERSIVQGEEAFVTESPAECMYFVMSGMLSYLHVDRPFEEVSVESGRRVAEVSLWAVWKHQGRLVGAARGSGLAQMSARELKQMARQCFLFKELAIYARFFISRCGRAHGESVISDLWGSNEDIRPVIAVAFAVDRYQALNRDGFDSEHAGGAGQSLMAFVERDEACFLRTVIMAWSFATKASRLDRRRGRFSRLRNLASDIFAHRQIRLPRKLWAVLAEGLRPLGRAKPIRKKTLSRDLSFSF